MTKKQISVFSMLRRVSDLIKKNITLLNVFPIFTELFGKYESNLTQIGSLIEQQEKDITGLATQKEVKRANATKLILNLSSRVVAYAKLTGNEVLAKEAYYSETDLNRLADDVFVKACRVIYSAAQSHSMELMGYGVTPEILSSADAAILAFEAVMDTPKEGYTGKKQTTTQLADLLAEEQAILGKIDLLVDILKDTQANFYTEYYDTRKVVYRSGSLAVKALITDAATGNPVSGVTVSFALDGVVVLEKVTADAGGFTVKSMEEGTYEVTISKLGYKTVIQPFNILADELATLEVKLQQNA